MSWGDAWKAKKLNSEGKNIPFDLPMIAFNAFKHNDFSFIQDRIMSIDRYRILGRNIEPSEVSDEEIDLLAEQAAKRAQEVCFKSFTFIQTFLE